MVRRWRGAEDFRAAVKRTFLPLVVAWAAVVAGCGSTSRTSSPPVSHVPPKGTCSSYLGGGVAVAMCSNKIAQGAQPLTITLPQEAARTGSAPGIAQAIGNALRDGERFEIGSTPDGAELLARFDLSPRQMLATGVFHIPANAKNQEIEAKISVQGDDVDTHLRLGTGQNLPAAYIYVPAGY
jgi:hypothetical protein